MNRQLGLLIISVILVPLSAAAQSLADLKCGQEIPGQFIVVQSGAVTAAVDRIKAADNLSQLVPDAEVESTASISGKSFFTVKSEDKDLTAEKLRQSLRDYDSTVIADRKLCAFDNLKGSVRAFSTNVPQQPLSLFIPDDYYTSQFIGGQTLLQSRNQSRPCEGGFCFYFEHSRSFLDDIENDGFVDLLSVVNSGAIFCSGLNCSDLRSAGFFSLLSDKKNSFDTSSDFAVRQIDDLTNPDQFATGDFDGDGLSDLLASKDSVAYLFLGNGQFVTRNFKEGNQTFQDIDAFRDIDGDGLLDVIKGGSTLGNEEIWRATSLGVWSKTTTIGNVSGLRFSDMVTLDFNRDGRKDFVVPSFSSNGQFAVFLLQADGTYVRTNYTSTYQGQPVDFDRFEFSDVTGDGEEDLIFTTDGACIDQTAQVFKKQGTAFPTGFVINLQQCLPAFTVGDYDRDGKSELIAAGKNDLYVFKFTDNAGTLAVAQQVLASFPHALSTQLSGARNITLFDPSGINGVTVQLTNTGSGVQFTARTDYRGEFKFSGLPAGSYSVAASRLGFDFLSHLGGTVSVSGNRSDVDFSAVSIPVVPAGNNPAANPINDPGFHGLWGLRNSGQTGGIAGVDIAVQGAWAFGKGDPAMIVAVLDDGVHVKHPDLETNVWRNPREIANGVDDDGNGYIDDLFGVDLIDGDSLPEGLGFHGTHVAGTIGAVADNALGVSGVAPGVKLMSVRVLGNDGSGSFTTILRGIEYILGMRQRGENVRVVNASLGGAGTCPGEVNNVLAALNAAGVVFVAAAGNEANNNDTNPVVPANCPADGVISVANLTDKGELAPSSNFGPANVDVGAPGTDILSTWPNGSYSEISGTSMAAPHTAGVAALMLSSNPALSPADVKKVLMQTSSSIPALQNLVGAPGIINATRAVEASRVSPGGPGNPGGPAARTFQFFGATLNKKKLSSKGGSINVTIDAEGLTQVTSIVLQSVEQLKSPSAKSNKLKIRSQTLVSPAGGSERRTLTGLLKIKLNKGATAPASRVVRVVFTLSDGRSVVAKIGTVKLG